MAARVLWKSPLDVLDTFGARTLLTFTNVGDSNTFIYFVYDTNPVIYYRINFGDFRLWNYTPIALNPGERCDMYGEGNSTMEGNSFRIIGYDGVVVATGDVGALVTSLTPHCFSQLFFGCSGLKSANIFHTTHLAEYCYEDMFRNCVNLTEITLPASILRTSCYYRMFRGCSSLSSVTVNFSKWDYPPIARPPIPETREWLENVSPTGIFRCPRALDTTIRDDSHIPVGWTVETF